MNKFICTLLITILLSNWNLFSQTTLTHNIGNTVIPNSMYSCSSGNICWARKFVLSDFGINSNQNFTINNAEVGLFYGINWDTNLQFNIYAIDSNFPTSFSESSLIGSSQVVGIPMNINVNQIITVNFTNPVVVPAGTGTILVEVFQLYSLNSDAHAFVASTEFDNDFSWFRSKNPGCPPYNTYATTQSLGITNAKFYITVNGQITNNGPFNMSILSNCNMFSKEFTLTNSSDISTVSWNFGDINSGSNNTSYSINPTHIFSSTGQYNVTAIVTNLSGQTYNVGQIINIMSPPVANIVQPLYACKDGINSNVASFNTSNIESTLLGSQTGMTVSYIDSNGNSLQTPLPNPLSSLTTTITARIARSNNPNCYAETNINLIVNPNPIIHPISPIFSCDDNTDGIAAFHLSSVISTLLGNQTGMLLNFYDGNGQILPNPLPNLYTNTTPNQEIITAKVTNPLTNCWVQTTFNLIVNTVYPPIVSSPQSFCIQQNVTLNNIIINGQNIKWYDLQSGGNQISNTMLVASGTSYYATQTINNCESLRVPVSVNIQNTSAPTGNAPQTFCSTQNPTLNDIVVNGTDLNWYNSSTNTISNTTLLVSGATYYVSQTINNCESISRLAVTVNLINTLNANDYSETFCDELNNGSENIDLTSYNNNLIANTSNCTFEYYSSLFGATNQTNSELITSTTNYSLAIGLHTIYVRITSNNGCHQIVQLNLSLVSKPILAISDILPICERGNITIDAGLGFDSYSWSTGSMSQAITIFQAGNYSVTVTTNHGNMVCSTTKNFTVILSNIATISNIETQDWTDTENVITINTIGYGDYEFSIDGINYQDSNVFYGLDSGAYTVYVRDKNGCGITEDDIFLLMYPKFFTPNGDGYNDTWTIKFSNIEPRLKVNIFDRYGKLLKTLNNTNSWDGKYNGKELPSSDYWFVVIRESGKEYRGHFTLKR